MASYGTIETDLETLTSKKVEVSFDIIPSFEEINQDNIMGIAFGYVAFETLLFLNNFKIEVSQLSEAAER